MWLRQMLRSEVRITPHHLFALPSAKLLQHRHRSALLRVPAYEAGFDCHILKPVDDRALEAVIERYSSEPTKEREALSALSPVRPLS
jgi:hypothetical protein